MPRTPSRVTTDPREAGGGIVRDTAAGDPTAHRNLTLDTSQAVLLDHTTMLLVHGTVHRDDDRIAMLLEGRINRTQDRASIMFMFDEDGAAALVSELLSLGHRMGPDFLKRLRERVTDLSTQGVLDQIGGAP